MNSNNNASRRMASLESSSAQRCKRSLLRDALQPGRPAAVVQFLLEHGALSAIDENNEDLLTMAVQNKSAEKVKMLLSHSHNSFPRKTLRQALCDAIRLAATTAYATGNGGNETEGISMIKALLKHVKADFSVQNSDNIMTTPLHCAIQYRTPLDVVRLLVEEGNANVNAMNEDNQTPLHEVERQTEIVSYLVQEAGADPNIPDREGYSTPLHYAASRGYLDVVKALTSTGAADPNALDKDCRTPLHDAIFYSFGDVATWLVEQAGASAASNCGVPFFKVVSFHLETTDEGSAAFLMPNQLIKLGIDPWETDNEGNSAMHFAVKTEDDGLDDEEDEDEDNLCAEGERLLGGGKRRLRYIAELVKHDPGLVQAKNHKGETPLHIAASWNNILLRTLVAKHGADLTAKDRLGRTPLIQAICKHGCSCQVECLLILMKERAVDINMGDRQGWSALHWACFLKDEATCRLLVEFGADPNALNAVGRPPLHLVGYPFDSHRRTQTFDDGDVTRLLRSRLVPVAARSAGNDDDDDNCEAVVDLLSRGADITVRDNEGNLSFFLAAATERQNASFVMLRAGAAQGLFDRRGVGTAAASSPTHSSARTSFKRRARGGLRKKPLSASNGGNKRARRTATRRSTRVE